MTLVAGIDSSTQSCKVVVADAETGSVRRTGTAAHPAGTEVDPQAWWDALLVAAVQAGGLDDVAAISVAGQQHGLVALDEDGAVVRPALLWNDTRSATAAADLVAELGDGDPVRGARAWADATGSVPLASFTVTKLRWLAEHEPAAAARVAAACLPHDWLTWRLAGGHDLSTLRTDRSDASGTGYFGTPGGRYRPDLVHRAFGRELVLPEVLPPSKPAGRTREGALLGAGAGDNAAAAFGLDLQPGELLLSIGTSGVVCAVTDTPTRDAEGLVAGFASATGGYLPLVCTLNGAPVLDATARLLGIDHDELARLALSVPPGADGLVLVPYLAGERTPNLPDSTGALHGITAGNLDAAHLARAAVEGLASGLADGADALIAHGPVAEQLVLIGGAARSPAVREIFSAVFGRPLVAPEPAEYVALGAARQAAWALAGGAQPPAWRRADAARSGAAATPAVRARYGEVRGMFARPVSSARG